MKYVKDNSECYNIAIQGINRTNNSNYQEVCIYPESEFILCNWYWSMAYICVIDPSEDKFIFPKFIKTVFKSGESRIDSKVSHMFQKVYELFDGFVQQ